MIFCDTLLVKTVTESITQSKTPLRLDSWQSHQPWVLCNVGYPSETHLKLNLAKSCSSITSVSVVQSLWNVAKSTLVSLPCSVQNFKTIGYVMKKLYSNEVSRDSLQWRHNEHGGVSNHRRLDCLPSRLFRRRSKNTEKLRVTGLCAGNSPVTVTSSNMENISFWWRHHQPATISDSSGWYCMWTIHITYSAVMMWHNIETTCMCTRAAGIPQARSRPLQTYITAFAY